MAATSPLSWSFSCSSQLKMGGTLHGDCAFPTGTGSGLTILAQKKAKKTRKIILKEDVTELGKKGELLEVKAGFYRNFLFPLGKAQIVTPLLVKEMKIEEERIEAEKRRDYDSFQVEVTMPKKSELESYLDDDKLDRNSELDILHYWKLNQFRFPQVSRMARDVLCISISTVASESTFSNSGRVLDQYRSALKHDIVEALVCTKDWLFGDQVDTTDPELDAVTDDIMGFNFDGSQTINPTDSANLAS